MQLNRRAFLAGTAAMAVARPWSKALGANEDIRVAVIGVNGIGKTHLQGWPKIPGVRLVGICDVDSEVLGSRADQFEKQHGKVTRYDDIRRVYDDPQVDAVVLAIPNHWHGLGTVWACQAGKHVYVEKPCSHNIWEAHQMQKAADKYKRIVQVGIQKRSCHYLGELFQELRNGLIGDITAVRAVYNNRRESIGKVNGPQKPPKTVNHDLWSGPAPTEILRQKYHYDWHWFWELGNGELGNNGPHLLDLARWVVNADEFPRSVTSVGGRYGWDDSGVTPNTHIIRYDYELAPILFEIHNLPVKTGAKDVPSELGTKVGLVVEGTEGKWVGFDEGEVYDRAGKVIRTVKNPTKEDGSRQVHRENFVAALRSGRPEDLNCPIKTGHLSTALCHIGNISHHLGSQQSAAAATERLAQDALLSETFGRMKSHLAANDIPVEKITVDLGPTLTIDPKTETFPGTPAANKLFRREYRKGFEVPEEV